MKENEKFLVESIDLLSREFGQPLPTLSGVMEKHQDSKINEEQYFDPKGEFKKYMDKVFKQAGIRVIKYDPMKQSFHDGTWGGFYTVASSNKVDMPGHGKVKRGSAVLPVYIDKKGQIELGVSGDGFKLGKAGSSQVLKNLKDFKKGDLDESVNEDVWTPAETKAVEKIDGEFQKMMAKKGIEPYSVEASRLWRSAGYNKKMRKIFGKNESVNEAENKIADIRKIFKTKKGKKIDSIFMDVETAEKVIKHYKSLKGNAKEKFVKQKIQNIVKSVDENVVLETPGAIAAAAATAVLHNASGKDVKVATALKNKEHPLHKRALSWVKSKMKKKDSPKTQSKSDSDFYRKQYS